MRQRWPERRRPCSPTCCPCQPFASCRDQSMSSTSMLWLINSIASRCCSWHVQFLHRQYHTKRHMCLEPPLAKCCADCLRVASEWQPLARHWLRGTKPLQMAPTSSCRQQSRGIRTRRCRRRPLSCSCQRACQRRCHQVWTAAHAVKATSTMCVGLGVLCSRRGVGSARPAPCSPHGGTMCAAWLVPAPSAADVTSHDVLHSSMLLPFALPRALRST